MLFLGFVVFSAGCIGQSGTSLIGGEGSDAPMEATVDITSDGFSPQTVTIQRGGTVTWINRMESTAWVASAMHPTHTQYPGVEYGEGSSYQGSQGCEAQGVQKEGAFDSCEGISTGEAFSFTFNEVGEWRYHNHFSPSMTGLVVVE